VAIRDLNRDYRGKDQPTDVLSFSQIDEIESNELPFSEQAAGIERPPRTLGDIVIALDTASRQAAALALPVAARLRTLLIHGLLHLLGYDHERSSAEARRMFARERALAAQLDRPATLAAPSVRRSTAVPKRAIPSKLAPEFP
jgi:rRNA maturation RNase YbeY